MYYGIAQLRLSWEEVWLMPFALLPDHWECHKQYNSITRPKQAVFIDEIIPDEISQ